MSIPEPVVAVVVAAGSGVRLGGPVPKALRELGGRPLVAWSVEAMAAGGADAVVVVVAEGMQPQFEAALGEARVPVTLVVGGADRQQSVSRGLAAVPQACRVVLVHDAARPLVPAEVVERVVDAVRGGATVVTPVVPVVDTIRRVDGEGSVVIDRSGLRAVQTPQGFDRATLVAAHAAVGGMFTDDVAVCEAAGERAVLVEGSRESLKVTEPFDLDVAEVVLTRRLAAAEGERDG